MEKKRHVTWKGGGMLHGQEGTCYIDNWGHDTWRGREMIHVISVIT